MTQTTAAISAKDAYISVASQDVSGSSNKVTLTPTLQAGRFFTFDGDWGKVVGDKFTWAGTIRAVYTETSNEALEELYSAFEGAAAVALVVAPKGNTGGNWQWSGNVLITEAPIELECGSGNAVMVEVSFEGDGTLTKAAIAT